MYYTIRDQSLEKRITFNEVAFMNLLFCFLFDDADFFADSIHTDLSDIQKVTKQLTDDYES